MGRYPIGLSALVVLFLTLAIGFADANAGAASEPANDLDKRALWESRHKRLARRLESTYRIPFTFGNRKKWKFTEEELKNVHPNGLTSSTGSKSGILNKPATDVQGRTIPDYDVLYEYDQLVDHNNPELGTFKQRYYHTWEFYKPGTLAEQLNGAVVLLEHRFYGASNPYNNFSTSVFQQVHTIEQAMDDFVGFARGVELPMARALALGGIGDPDSVGGREKLQKVITGRRLSDSEKRKVEEEVRKLRPDRTPWVMMGGSYMGALTSWTMNERPGTFWAGYSSSGVVQPLACVQFWLHLLLSMTYEGSRRDFWQYWSLVAHYMPQNCTTSVASVISYIDSTVDTWMETGNGTELEQVQRDFGMPGVDVVLFLNMREWQSLDVTSEERGGSYFYEFCDLLQTSSNGTVNSICQYAFPEAFGSTSTDSINATAQVEAANSRVDSTSQKLKGWKSTADRLFVVNGARDPWLEVTWSTSLPLSQTDLPPSTNASSELLMPRFEGYALYDSNSNEGSSTRGSDDTTGNGLFPSSPTRPIYLTDGFHCSDMQGVNAGADESIARVWVDVAERFGEWVEEFEVEWTEVDGEGGAATGLRASRRVGVIWVVIAAGIFGIFWL
ncbi:endoprotease [Coprinopsis cinerea okayama7|uniref:Endoprotease n=1 Tax=Coprinopsis cinerea (strain Okayama-7 / 130 / ATCC MYA-4618 / FGSC 9003) TaxID=240176 RepID=D6RPQ0_COPC7|nr:endoprotease [Coprinopsis cinerea okayama7\|eukprot:XP_002910507.1 endoprotease [Coprinopsis cinerea okayama7\